MGLLWAMTLPGLACPLILLAFVEVAWSRATGRGLLPWFHERKSRSVAATGFEEVAALFQGSKHHEFEQRRTTLMHREDGTDGAPPLLRVDLDAGSVRVNRPD
ncbi:hypothetical protein EGT67_10860 [Prescottella agglutinans]|uniref:Uncharacterized protein n=1 Tax=Prescottella agglutinans TaxID=1644129 RepID=A0A438BE98_9NOCA|nr:DUF6191 domain-containing protein [Prescottella agglutinans]RVW09298.1 hypothetical protein EGT67_10860 [Prescottella agglutinans]